MAKFEEDNYNKKNFAELKINVHKALKVLKQKGVSMTDEEKAEEIIQDLNKNK